MHGEPVGVDLLSVAAREASRRGQFVVAMYLQKAVVEHELHGCSSAPEPCAYEIEATRVLITGF